MSGNRSISRLCCYIALVTAALIFVVNFVLGLFEADLGKIGVILNFVKELSLLIGVGVCAYEYAVSAKTSNRKALVLIYWVSIIVYICFAVLGIF